MSAALDCARLEAGVTPVAETRIPNNLPDPLTTFVGRERELDELREVLAQTRLLTLVGAGGCGKTRLALELAANALDRFPDGAWWIELAPHNDPALVGQELASALGVRPRPGQTYVEAAVRRLARRSALVVLDNCEHLRAACADAAEAVLHGAPKTTVLVTSRTPLGVGGEFVWRVPSLALPPGDREHVEEIMRSDAVRLFRERSADLRPRFAITDETAPLAARICKELDGIPLAIELAAARVRMLSLEQIATGLTDRFHLLTGGARTALPRQQTLRGSVEWSHDLLAADEQVLFRRLAVFAGGFTLDGVEEVAPGNGLERSAILDLLASLVDGSLVLVEDRERAVRYRLLETVRQFARERLRDADEVDAVRDRHCGFFVALAERAAPELTTARQHEWLDLLDDEAANLADAIEWSARTRPERALRLCAALTYWWRSRGLFGVGERAFAQALGAADVGPSFLRARVLWGRAYLLGWTGKREAAAAAEEAFAAAEELGDESMIARALLVLGQIHGTADPMAWRPKLERARELARSSGDELVLIHITTILAWNHLFCDEYEEGARVLEEQRPLLDRIGHRGSLAWRWHAMSWAPFFHGQFERFSEFEQRALAASREVRDPVTEGFVEAMTALLELYQGNAAAAVVRLEAARERLIAAGVGHLIPYAVETFLAAAHAAVGKIERARVGLEALVASGADSGYWLAWATIQLAEVLRVSGDDAGARERASETLETSERVRNPMLIAWSKEVLGRLAAARGEWAGAEALLHDALTTRCERRLWIHVPQTLEVLAEIAAGLESYDEAARLLGTAEGGRRDLGLVRWPPDEPRFAQLKRRLREALGDEGFATARAEGAGLTLEEASAWVRRARGSRKRPSHGWESLTPTELEVVHLAGEGLTNPEIGKRMFISRGTVKAHLAHIYRKLGVKNRSELAAKAASRELHSR